jgi:hypothetical protein
VLPVPDALAVPQGEEAGRTAAVALRALVAFALDGNPPPGAFVFD